MGKYLLCYSEMSTPGVDETLSQLSTTADSLGSKIAELQEKVNELAKTIDGAGELPDPESEVVDDELVGGTFAVGAGIHENLKNTLHGIVGSSGISGSGKSVELSTLDFVGAAADSLSKDLENIEETLSTRVANIQSLKNVMNQSVDKLYNLVKQIDSDGTTESTASLVKEVHQKLNEELDSQLKSLQRILKLKVKPTATELNELIKDNANFKTLASKLGMDYNTTEASDRLALAYTNVSKMQLTAKNVKDALKTLEISLDKYKEIKSLDELKKVLAEILKKKTTTAKAEELKKTLKAMDILKNANKVKDKLDISGAAEAIGRVRVNNGQSKLSKQVKTYESAVQEIFNNFLNQVGQNFNEVRKAVEQIGDTLGESVVYNDELSTFIKLFEIFVTDIKDGAVFYALISLNQTVSGRELKNRFIGNINACISALDNVDAKLLQDVKQQLSAVKETVETYNDIIVVMRDQEKKKTGGFEWTTLSTVAPASVAGHIKDTLVKLKFYANLVFLKTNLKSVSTELTGHDEEYKALLGRAIGSKLSALQKEFTEANDRLDDDTRGRGLLLKQWNAANPNDKLSKGFVERIYKIQYDARLGLYKTVEAVDLFLSKFTQVISQDINALKELNTILAQTELVSTWAGPQTKTHLDTLFNTVIAPAAGGVFSDTNKMRAALESCKETIQGVAVLKNIMSMFAKIGDKFGDRKISEEIYMTPGTMYNNLVRYIWVSAFTMGAGSAGGNTAAPIPNDPATKGTYDSETGDKQSFFDIKMTKTNDPVDSFEMDDKYFILVLKAISAKVLSVVGISNMLNRPAKNATMLANPVRSIMGAAETTVKEENVELYIRLPLLVEFYKNVFGNGNDDYKKNKLADNDEETIAYVPEIGSKWSGLIKTIFDDSRQSVDGIYSPDNMRAVINEINMIASDYPDTPDRARNVILDLVKEINRRYGVIKKKDLNDFYQSKKKYENVTDKIASSSSEDILDFGEEDVSELGPSSDFVTSAVSLNANKSKSEQNDLKIVEDFRKSIAAEINKTDLSDVSDKSFNDRVKYYKSLVKNASSETEKVELCIKAIDAAEDLSSINSDILMVFHELVTFPLASLGQLFDKYKNASSKINWDSLSLDDDGKTALQLAMLLEASREEKNEVFAKRLGLTSYEDLLEFFKINKRSLQLVLQSLQKHGYRSAMIPATAPVFVTTGIDLIPESTALPGSFDPFVGLAPSKIKFNRRLSGDAVPVTSNPFADNGNPFTGNHLSSVNPFAVSTVPATGNPFAAPTAIPATGNPFDAFGPAVTASPVVPVVAATGNPFAGNPLSSANPFAAVATNSNPFTPAGPATMFPSSAPIDVEMEDVEMEDVSDEPEDASDDPQIVDLTERMSRMRASSPRTPLSARRSVKIADAAMAKLLGDQNEEKNKNAIKHLDDLINELESNKNQSVGKREDMIYELFSLLVFWYNENDRKQFDKVIAQLVKEHADRNQEEIVDSVDSRILTLVRSGHSAGAFGEELKTIVENIVNVLNGPQYVAKGAFIASFVDMYFGKVGSSPADVAQKISDAVQNIKLTGNDKLDHAAIVEAILRSVSDKAADLYKSGVPGILAAGSMTRTQMMSFLMQHFQSECMKLKFLSTDKLALDYSDFKKTTEQVLEHVKYAISHLRINVPPLVVKSCEEEASRLEVELLQQFINGDASGSPYEFISLDRLNSTVMNLKADDEKIRDIYSHVVGINGCTRSQASRSSNALVKEIYKAYNQRTRAWEPISNAHVISEISGAYSDSNSLLLKFNQLLMDYLSTFYDSSTKKFFVELVDEFNRSQVGEGFADIDNNNVNVNGNYPSNNEAVSNSILFIVQELLSRQVDNRTDVKKFAVSDLNDVSSSMQEKYKTHLPTFAALFSKMAENGVLYKRVLETSKISNAGTLPATVPAQPATVPVNMNSDSGELIREFKSVIENTNDVNEEQNKIRALLDSIIEASRTIANDAARVMRIMNYAPRHMQIKTDFETTYKSNFGKIPLSPLSIVTHPMTIRDVLPSSGLNVSQIKLIRGMQYGLYSEIKKENLTWFSELLNAVNVNGPKSLSIDESKAFNSLVLSAKLAKCSFEHDVINQIAQRNTGTNFTLGNVFTFYQMNSVANSNSDSLAITENSNMEENKKKFTMLYTASSGPEIDRKKARILNLVDMNINPINVHSIMKEIPLSFVYNYAITFDAIVEADFKNATGAAGALGGLLIDPHFRAAVAKGDIIQSLTQPFNHGGFSFKIGKLTKDIHTATAANDDNLDFKFVRNLLFVTNLQRYLLTKIRTETQKIDSRRIKGLQVINENVTGFDDVSGNIERDEFSLIEL
jgi:hypothetical protein